jgi:hypothetical protein
VIAVVKSLAAFLALAAVFTLSVPALAQHRFKVQPDDTLRYETNEHHIHRTRIQRLLDGANPPALDVVEGRMEHGVCLVPLRAVAEWLGAYVEFDRATQGDALLGEVGSKVVCLPVRSPNLNAYAERWVRTVRQECLERVIVLNESHLRWVLREFIRHCNSRRPHRSLALRPPEGPVHSSSEGEVIRRQILGGLINDYYREAA